MEINKMNRSELVAAVAEATDVPVSAVDRVLRAGRPSWCATQQTEQR